MDPRTVKRALIVWGPPILLFVLIRLAWHPLTLHAQIGRHMHAETQGFLEFYFYPTNCLEVPCEEVVFSANERCDQENVISQLKNGIHALRMPTGDLYSNWRGTSSLAETALALSKTSSSIVSVVRMYSSQQDY